MSSTPAHAELPRRPGARHDLVSGTALLAVATLYFLGTRTLPDGRGEPGPAFFPVVLAVALAILAVVLLAGGVRAVARSRRSIGEPGLKPRATWTPSPTAPTSVRTAPRPRAAPTKSIPAQTTPPASAAREPAMRRDVAWKAAAAASLSAAYVALFQPLGFVASTWLYTLSIAALDRGAGRRALLVVPAVSTLLAYLLFRVALGVGLPRGPFG